MTDTIKYGYDDARKHEIIVHLEVTENSLNIEICDDGREFNPFNEPEPNVSLRFHEPDRWPWHPLHLAIAGHLRVPTARGTKHRETQ